MAGKKKAKKPAANPARGFATTSVASKVRVDPAESPDDITPASNVSDAAAPPPNDVPQTATTNNTKTVEKVPEQQLSPEEFERQLEESALQLLVEKYAQKVRKDALRQKTRLETDRRLLRAAAETINTRKWLPQELMDHVLGLIRAEGRFAASSVGSEGATSRLPSEEDLIIRLWTLQETLENSGFPEDRIQPALHFVLDIAPNIPYNSRSELVWGLEEVLDWFARECSREELPDYSGRKTGSKSQADTPADTPSRSATPLEIDPRLGTKIKGGALNQSRTVSPKRRTVTYDEEIEPDQLLPFYLETKTKLFAIQRPRQDTAKRKGTKNKTESSNDPEEVLLLAKLDRAEKDVLFDKYVAEQQWRNKRIVLEKEYAAARAEEKKNEAPEEPPAANDSNDVNTEAERIAAEILAEDSDDDGLADLFSSLPVSEVDPVTGKTNTVVNGADGSRIIIRDFGKWTGVTPMRALEEACRSRDSSVKISYHVLSDVAFASRHAVNIVWSKPQEIPPVSEISELEAFTSPTQFVYKMMSIATPDAKQSEAYIATTALFCVFGSSGKEEKVALRLPATWKDLWSEYAEAKKNKADEEDRNILRHIRDLVRKRVEQELEDGVLIQGFKGRGHAKNQTDSDHSDQERAKRQPYGPEYYQNIWLHKSSSHKFQQMLASRMQLPMWQFRQQVVDVVEKHQVVIICGETGCGKSTQVPSFLLEHQLLQGKPCKIYCTEPRRISAISLARRVSEELGENKGEIGTNRSLVGYSIRLESNTARETRLVYATTGIVMRMLEGSNDLQDITHLVLDEVHERSIDSDFLLIVLKKLLVRRKDLKVVLMSATVDAERFSKYLSGAPVLTVPGRTFPVRVAYLEDAVELTGYTVDQRNQEKVTELDDDAEPEVDSSSKPELLKELRHYSARTRNTLAQMDEYRMEYELIVQLISRIAVDPDYAPYSKAILVFLPGIAEIRTVNDMLLGDRSFADNWLVYPMHSSIASEEQEAAFLIPPPGMRKIVLATNIAETGITIPDVTCVIDTGKHREMRFDERRQLSRLIDCFISRANAKQRRGRAGRVQEGLCFHLFTKYRHDTSMNDQQTPEMLRLSLQDLAIRVKICKIGGIEDTLSQALDPPSAKNIRRAIDALVDVRALTASTEELTPLGLQLARLPLDVFLGKLILLGAVFKCLDMTITVAAILSSKSPFVAPFGQRSQADSVRRGFRKGDSDLLTAYNAYTAWKRVCQSATSGGAEFQFCRKNFLAPQTLANIEDLKGQLLVAVADSGFLQLTDDERQTLKRLRFSGRRRHQAFFDVPKRVNTNSDNEVVAQSVIAWSFYPKLLVRDAGSKGLRNVGNNQSISLHPSSVNKGYNDLRWLSYYHIMQSKAFYNAHETTATDPFAIALLCGDVRADMYSGVFVLDGNRARFAVPDWKTMLVMKVLRARLREMLTRCFKSPGKLPTAQHERWLEVWQRVFTLAQEAREKNLLAAAAAAAAAAATATATTTTTTTAAGTAAAVGGR
ncbi:P-loop containing nucleoside triphosphate hydrolase protein [Chaetomidium leptoderma]|uniref:RNA helicase n=1 Tax=Chaetomidium leptoderma TaxID=669021 RepID=A0AAN6VPK7_9PEZI|nr:P-loop containing nucleoside triphosphate hydrolase protein [Chaetomidium leptoderma]